ncbi:MAG: hypothetical protein L0G99_12495, partial [Propionibacteriales bacterium]|nr:hypothetical protein [Propionibacteriales bacterium]
TAKGEVPPGSSAPPPSGSAEKPASSGPEATSAPETESGDAGGERTLTWVALAFAGGLAVLAAGLAALAGLRRTGGQHTVAAAAAGESADDDDRDDALRWDADRDEADGEVEGDEGDLDDAYGDDPNQPTDERGAVGAGAAAGVMAARRVAEPAAEAPRPARRSSGAHAVPRSAPVIPDDDEDADVTRKRAGSRFDAFFRPRRARHNVPETADTDPVTPRRGERPEPDDLARDDLPDDVPADDGVPEPERRAAARSDLDPAPRAWLDAAFDASRGEPRPRRARDDD